MRVMEKGTSILSATHEDSRANPDAIYVPGYYTEVGLICLQGRRSGNQGSADGRGWLGQRQDFRDREGCD